MRQQKLWWQSSYDRGIQHLLKMWPKIKEKFPDATLDICYGWNLFDKAYFNNPERMAWKASMQELMKQDGITEHGRIGQDKMKEIRSQCGIWSYSTDFQETNCIGALECQRDGVVPCVINLAGLKDTVGSGVRVEGDIYDPETREEYIKQLLDLMGDKKRWEKEIENGIKFAYNFNWDKISNDWIKVFA